MDTPAKPDTVNLSPFRDEELVVLAQVYDYQPATGEPMKRYYDWLRQRIAYLARRTPLNPSDVEDAQQEAVFALLRAVVDYDITQI